MFAAEKSSNTVHHVGVGTLGSFLCAHYETTRLLKVCQNRYLHHDALVDVSLEVWPSMVLPFEAIHRCIVHRGRGLKMSARARYQWYYRGTSTFEQSSSCRGKFSKQAGPEPCFKRTWI